MSDPRLCSSLRLPQPVDNKNGKDCEGRLEGGGRSPTVVKEEASLHPTDYVLSQGYQLQPPSSSPTLAYTLPETSPHASVLYMYPGPESPKVHYTSELPTTSGVSPPSLRLASPHQGEVPGVTMATLATAQTTCCTFSLADFGAVSPLVSSGQDAHHLHPSIPLAVTEVEPL